MDARRKLLALVILGGCASNVPPSDPLLIMRTATVDGSLKDAPSSAGQPPTITIGSDTSVVMAASGTGLSTARPAAGLSSLSSGLLAGLDLLAATPHVLAAGCMILVWTPAADAVPTKELHARYANTVAGAWANALGARVPDGRFTPHTIPDTPTTSQVSAWIERDDPHCRTSGITCRLTVAPFDETSWPQKPGPIPARLAGFTGAQTFVALSLAIGTFNKTHLLRTTRTSRWPMLEALTDASRSMPPYAWVYLGPGNATWQSPTGLKWTGEPLMLNQGEILRFIRPTTDVAQQNGEP